VENILFDPQTTNITGFLDFDITMFVSTPALAYYKLYSFLRNPGNLSSLIESEESPIGEEEGATGDFLITGIEKPELNCDFLKFCYHQMVHENILRPGEIEAWYKFAGLCWLVNNLVEFQLESEDKETEEHDAKIKTLDENLLKYLEHYGYWFVDEQHSFGETCS